MTAQDTSLPMISAKQLRFVYPRGGVVALDDVSIDIPAGQSVGIVGQNGSGKTTFTKTLNGLLRPSGGTVHVDGLDTSKLTVQQLASTVGYVFQNPNHQLFATSVAAELAFGPTNLKLPKDEIEARVAEALEFFDLGEHAKSHPYRLSFPLRKLVGIASVFTMHPKIFVLDEPTTGQDHQTTRIINRLIHRLQDRGATVVTVAHDMPLLADVSERLIVMWSSKVVLDGTPREVFANREVMDLTHITPPQITQISLGMPSRAGRPAALSVEELAEDVRAGKESR